MPKRLRPLPVEEVNGTLGLCQPLRIVWMFHAVLSTLLDD